MTKDGSKKANKSSEKHEPPALSQDALFTKSRLYVHRALHAKSAAEADVYQLWAALALELLGKASLSKIHPGLVVESTNPNSLLEACGISTGTAVRTVDASIVFARLKHTVPHFGTPISEACKNLSMRRNAELHSGHAAFSGMPLKAWEGDFWSAAQLILASMSLDLDDWLGTESSETKALLNQLRHVKREAALQRVTHASAMFQEKPDGGKRSKREKDELRIASEKFRSYDFVNKFRYALDNVWASKCPACESVGFLGGDKISEEFVEVQADYPPGWELLEYEYAPAEFFCPTCDLQLDGDEALSAVGLGDSYWEEHEREVEYEPEYGND